jgi:hypothetical protein
LQAVTSISEELVTFIFRVEVSQVIVWVGYIGRMANGNGETGENLKGKTCKEGPKKGQLSGKAFVRATGQWKTRWKCKPHP